MLSASRAADSSSSSRSKRSDGDKDSVPGLHSKITQLKKQIQAARLASIKERIEKNARELGRHACQLLDAAAGRGVGENVLSARMGSVLCMLGGWESGEREGAVCSQEEVPGNGTVVFGSNSGKTAVRLVRLPHVDKIPPYTTWIFLNRNQRMAEDQSVVGRRQIYYDDRYGSEALICSDSEEEIPEPEEEKHGFSKGEDEILWKTLQQHGPSQPVLNVLCQFIEATPSDIEERYEILVRKYKEENGEHLEASGEMESNGKSFLDKTLSAALDSFDNLFCRRCLIFDCRLHGCSQGLIIPSEKLSSVFELEEHKTPCSNQCYLQGSEAVRSQCLDISDVIMGGTEPKISKEKLCAGASSESEDDNRELIESAQMCANVNRQLNISSEIAEESRTQSTETAFDTDTTISETISRIIGKRKILRHEDHSLTKTMSMAEICSGSSDKRQKKLLVGKDPLIIQEPEGTHPVSVTDAKSRDSEAPCAQKHLKEGCEGEKAADSWSRIEKDLYLKGIEIFGKNSCLIARNLLSGLKTCMEVSKYMLNNGISIPSRPVLANSCFEDNGKADHDYMEQDMPPRTRIWRRRGRSRKLKYTWKSAGHPSIRKRIGDGKHQSCKQYTPCGCKNMCGKQCPCMNNGTCCEKYCGCSKSCKNRFRGCHCAKSQCRSRQCPCFAAGRECDPDVCRNCWVSCGDGSLEEPPARGDGYQCGNMHLLLKQQQRILLGGSDVAGWGAFIKNPVHKNDYLGEYTGELISHKEADKRGKIYDRANSSFLFDLNDQYVLDAYRKGDKLKFANHSSNPNCYAKVMLVAGDHRVGIFAKEHIEVGEELFYDYRYGPDQAPAWARKPEGSKREDSSASHSRAQKVA